MRKQPPLLDDVTHAAAQGWRAGAGDRFAIEHDAARIRRDEAVHQPQQGRFSAAAGTDQRGGPAGRDVEIGTHDRTNRPERLADI